MPRRFALPVLLALAALLLLATGGRPAAAGGSRPAPCWLLDSPQLAYVSGGGHALLRQQCGAAQTGARPGAAAQPSSPAAVPARAAASASAGPPTGFGSDVRANDPAADEPPHTTQSEATVAPCGRTVLAAWNDSGGPNLTGYGRSGNGGATWADLGAIPGFTGSDPVLAADNDCRFYFSAITFVGGCGAIGVARSDDGGWTWGPVASASPGTPCANFQDKQGIAVDRTPGPSAGNVYACWDDRGRSEIRVLFSRSLDGGRTFSEPVTLSSFAFGFATGCQVGVRPGGDVFAVWTQGDTLSLNMRRSVDAGNSFGPEVRITGTVSLAPFKFCGPNEIRPVLNGDIRSFNWPSFAVNPLTGSLHVAWNDSRSGDPDVLYARSGDGLIWDAPVRLNDDATETDQFQPALAFTEGGLLRVIWYDRRLDPEANLMIDVYSATSQDDGETFSANERITDVSFGVPPLNPNFDSRLFACYMGDYVGIAGANGVHYMAWGDNRNIVEGHPDPDIYFERRSTAHLGDVDCDLDTDAGDALGVLRALGGLGPPGACLHSGGDTNCDGATTALDAVAILDFLAGARPPPRAPGCPEVGV
ncbi:MAG: hypothetical protein Q7T33_07315 [Dehalococcoidia bacterium]|nr:hypothetical protein [Dehalococcoidia bacterium]